MNAPSARPSDRASTWLCAVVIGVVAATPPRATGTEIHEDIWKVPIEVATSPRTASPTRLDMLVTVVRPRRPGRQPFIILLHGRPASADDFVKIGRAEYPTNARYFADLGFTVLVPTRIGYGVTGGPDVEYTGPCHDKRPEDGASAALREVRALISVIQKDPHIDPQHGVILGESFGGLVAVAAASSKLPGIRATINIAGGDGGDSLHHVDAPCDPDKLTAAFRHFGAINRLPTLWVYSSNDRFWGAEFPHRWFDEFRRAGGRGQFEALPADKNNGHFVFTRNPPLWQPAVVSFLTPLMLPTTATSSGPLNPERTR